MTYTTQIDTVGLQVDCTTEYEQRLVLDHLGEFIQYEPTLFQQQRSYQVANMTRIEHYVYQNNTTLATINTGVFRAGNAKEGYTMQYYVSVKFAGLKRYDEVLDTSSANFLFSICAFLNGNGIVFKLTELDVCIDVTCPFNHLLTVCTQKAPKTDYYALNENQVFNTTTYVEKLSQKKLGKAVLRAYIYDKRAKEGLAYDMTRFELKLQPKYFNKYGFDVESIANALSRYYVMYYEDTRVREAKIDKYCSYSKVKKREIDRLKFAEYRLFADMDYIGGFIRGMLNARF